MSPNFMCIGAAKSGTTTLYDTLKHHPEIFTTRFKEPHFFDIPENYKKGFSWYKDMYFGNADHKIASDFTPSYFFEKDSPRRIHYHLGENIKFVVLLRNPVDRAYSHFLHSCRDGHESLDFKTALFKEEERLNQYLKNDQYLFYLRHSYYHQGLYGDMIERYLNYFSLENFFFIHFENEFINNREQTIHNLLSFLEISKNIPLRSDIRSNPASQTRFDFINDIMNSEGWFRDVLKYLFPSSQLRQIIRNKIHRANIKEVYPDKISEDLRIDIYNYYFKDNISKLEKLTNRNFNWT